MYKTTVKIDGMACSMCEAHVNEAIRRALPDAKKVTSSHTQKTASFLTEEKADLDKVKKAINATGYVFISAETEAYTKKKGLFGLGL
jgi:copper chaperone CopZ